MPALLKKALIAGPIALAMMGTAWYFVWRDTSFAQAAEPDIKTPSPAASLSGLAAGPAVGARNGAAPVSAEQYVEQLIPKVADVPWSASAWASRPVLSDPHVYCISTESTCRCVTEQNTRPTWHIRDDVCREIARWGEPYNPHKAPASPVQEASHPHDAGEGGDKSAAPAPGLAGTVVAGHPSQVTGAGIVL